MGHANRNAITLQFVCHLPKSRKGRSEATCHVNLAQVASEPGPPTALFHSFMPAAREEMGLGIPNAVI